MKYWHIAILTCSLLNLPTIYAEEITLKPLSEIATRTEMVSFSSIRKSAIRFADIHWVKNRQSEAASKKQFSWLKSNLENSLNLNKENVSEHTLRYVNDLTVTMFLLGHISESEIQTIEIETQEEWKTLISYVSAFNINVKNKDKIIGTMLEITSVDNAKRILETNANVIEFSGDLSLAGISESYIEDVKGYSLEAQKLFMNVFNKYSTQYKWQDLDDFHYELTGVMGMFDKVPTDTITIADEVKGLFEWDLSNIVSAAEARAEFLQKEDIIRSDEYLVAVKINEDLRAWNEDLRAWNEDLRAWNEDLRKSLKIIDKLYAQLGKKN